MQNCCSKFKENIGQFEQADDGSWNVNGCCGGGCYVLSEIRFCPYCGRHLTKRTIDRLVAWLVQVFSCKPLES